MVTSSEIKRLAKEYGADLVGIAPIDRFRQLPAEANPLNIKPDAQSVIVLAFSIPRGGLRGVEAGMAWSTYTVSMSLWNTAIECAYLVSRALEKEGWESAPLYPQPRDQRNQGVRVHPDKPEPNIIVELEYAAHAAGLGEIGRGKIFLTPEFGPRQFFTAILTDAVLEPDAPFAGGLCDDCGACAQACPSRALDQASQEEVPLCNGTLRWYTLHQESCRVCQTGPVSYPYTNSSDPSRISAACGRACVAHLEDGGKLTRRFFAPFRTPVQQEAE